MGEKPASEVLGFYRFQQLTDPASAAIAFYDAAREYRLLGSIIAAPEGWNVSVWGPAESLDLFLKALPADLAPVQHEMKRIEVAEAPFRKLTKKVKQEIIKFKIPVDTKVGDGTHLSPEEFHKMLTEKRDDILLLDTRNTYEIKEGTFDGAEHLDIDNFHELPGALDKKPLPDDRTIVTFCTGGIRCEKVVPFLKGKGYSKVFQIDGGIWRYLEKYPDGYFKGNCFWFDGRSSMDARTEAYQERAEKKTGR